MFGKILLEKCIIICNGKKHLKNVLIDETNYSIRISQMNKALETFM